MIKKSLILLLTFLIITTPICADAKQKKYQRKSKQIITKHVKSTPSVVKLTTKEPNYDKLFEWCKDRADSNVREADLRKILSHVSSKDDPLLLISMINAESNFDKSAISKRRAVGLMQIRPKVWLPTLRKEFPDIKGYNDLLKISNNIDAGEYILRRYISEKGSLRKALYCYSGGSKRYVKKVLNTYYIVSLASNAWVESDTVIAINILKNIYKIMGNG